MNLHINAAEHGVRAQNCMVATGHPLAAEAALKVLAEGGSAIDAAITADAILGVVEPMATGIGGDLLAMIVPSDGKAITYNGTGRAPAALTADQVEALPGRRIPERHALSVTTPGAVRGWFDLHARFGRLDFARLLAPAIALAEGGFAVAPICAREWKLFEPVIARDLVSAKLYRAGAVPAAGDIFTNPELAAVLKAIAADGPAAFYEGEPARAAAEASKASGGVLAEADFRAHTGDFRDPVSAVFRGLTVLECPPNTHGVAVLEALSALEPLALRRDDPETMVLAARAMAAGLAHARKTVADPAGNTVCTVIVDASGLAITLMTSVFKRFGSGIGVPGCGFVLQNRGSGFAEPGHINGPAPGKRPYHTVVPAAALKDGCFHAGFGVVGGAMQPQGHVQLLLRIAAWGEPLQAALDAPRWRLESDTALAIEAGTPQPIVDAFRAAGFTDPAGSGELAGRSDFGGAQIVMRASDGSLIGASDKRKDGVARGA
ncbi:gamma-glutamyltransferase [Kaistia dalseonensis]|uniref:Gamma-glutamyltranspeptidase/glutathione hydrolase n=1 Tax=Kaistia dalseonensis TaxID=410840 RepID=A0ABU0HCK4_9HYPH|nr:gamma-glutamyltransferase [Kaistia dalseonensis]MCX5496633.1 gamma-glutamyltransferase [Kaistia dalseonensis]MDQ0439256.1 gamma-glutamyltranspeptidase/glutathione hydrolase [Kaistia dalseonensis]